MHYTGIRKRQGVHSMLIRRMTKWDYDAVDRLLLQLQQQDAQERPDLFVPMAHYMTRDSFDCLLDNDNVVAFLAQERLETVACCFVSMLDRSAVHPVKVAYIDLLVVDAAHRRQGIGRKMFAEVERQARRAGAQKVELTVWSHNKIAQQAYAAYGMMPQRSIYEMGV